MSGFYQATGGVLIAVILVLTLGKQGKEMALVISIAVSSMVLMSAVAFLGPVISFLRDLETIAGLDNELIQILYKAISIAFVSEIAGLVSKDAGNESMGKTLGILATAVILWLSIPVFRGLLDLIRKILGGV